MSCSKIYSILLQCWRTKIAKDFLTFNAPHCSPGHQCTARTFGIITRDICWSIRSRHYCGQWIRLTLTQKITSCGWLSDIPRLLLCSSCFQTLFTLKIMTFLKLVEGSADSPVKDNLFIPEEIHMQGKSHSDSSLCWCRSMLMAHKVSAIQTIHLLQWLC